MGDGDGLFGIGMLLSAGRGTGMYDCSESPDEAEEDDDEGTIEIIAEGPVADDEEDDDVEKEENELGTYELSQSSLDDFGLTVSDSPLLIALVTFLGGT